MIARRETLKMRHTDQKLRLSESAAAYLKEHYTDKFSLDQIADALFINKNYLARVYKEVTGRTLLWDHNHLRCEAAKELLEDRGLTISVVAYKTGFSSSSHFSRIFKIHTGVTPSEYRRRPAR